MKILKGIGVFIVLLIAIYVVLGFVGPADYRVERSIEIEADATIVFDQTTKFANWAAWSPWAAADPGAKYTIEKDEQAVGAVMGWDGEVSGKGNMTITEIVPNEKMVYSLTFIEPWVMSSVGGFNYIKEGNAIKVVWYDQGDIPFSQRPMMLFMDLEEMMGPQFEEGLANIKEICEKMNAEPSIEVTEETVESKAILYISESSSLMPDAISAKMGAAYGEIMALMGIAQLDMASAPIAITKKFSIEEMECEFDAAIPVVNLPEDLALDGRIKKGETYAGKALKTIHVGSYMKLKATYDGMLAYIKAKGYEINGDSWEEYIDDPAEVVEDERRTLIYFPIK
ncbi:MAG: SRPBCC family protein [Vicingaceae bacterium]